MPIPISILLKKQAEERYMIIVKDLRNQKEYTINKKAIQGINRAYDTLDRLESVLEGHSHLELIQKIPVVL